MLGFNNPQEFGLCAQGDIADLVKKDSALDTYPTSRPVGGIDDPNSKLYPFKYKTAVQPKTVRDDRLIALDTFEYLKVSGDVGKAVQNGLVNMGYSGTEPYAWVFTDTYGLINHGIPPASAALRCGDCHQSILRMDLKGDIGYAPKDGLAMLCVQCHGRKENKGFEKLHDLHVTRKKYDCAWCHTFSRPEKGLKAP